MKLPALFSRLESRPRLLKALRCLVVLLFPPVLVLAVESVNLPDLLSLVLDTPGVFLFDILLTGALFAVFSLLLRRVWIAALLQSAAFFLLALTEYFKFDANGVHFTLADIALMGALSDVTHFAHIQPEPGIVAAGAVLVLWTLFLAFLRVRIRMSWPCSAAAGAAVLAAVVCVVCVPPAYGAVYTAFGIDYRAADAPDANAQRIAANRQIAFLSQNLSLRVTRALSRGAPPTQAQVEALLPAATSRADAQTPDVVIVMSEAFADFRRFPGLAVPEGVYTNFDALAAQGALGTAIVPTFGGYTCKTEFELVFGLPVRGITSAELPHQLFLDGTPRPTVASHLASLGYRTAFIHPYSGAFYGRAKAYRAYGFESLVFEDAFTVEQQRLNGYLDDSTLTRQILAELENSGDAPGFVYAVSMQNHGPYTMEGEALPVTDERLTEQDRQELGRYLYQIQRTDAALGELAAALRARARPTLLLFVGDHYPYLGSRSAMYQKFAPGGDVYALYRQSYLLWSSDGRALTAPAGEISTFYLPYVAMRAGNIAGSRFTAKMGALLQSTPLASFDLGQGSAGWNDLMLLTQDRTTGAGYSASTAEPQS